MKYLPLPRKQGVCRSPPARGAWIEISGMPHGSDITDRRPPHGGRGLKCTYPGIRWHIPVAPRTGGVD